MKKIVQFIIMSLLFSGVVFANKVTQHNLSVAILSQSPQHATESKRITDRFLRSHYELFSLDSDFSEKIFDRYIDRLDPNRDTFLSKDIIYFESKRRQLGEEMRSGTLSTAFGLYNILQQRRLQRYQYAISLLNQPITFDDNDYIELAGDKKISPVSVEQLKKRWFLRVKFDALNLKLTGKEWPDIKIILTKRYQQIITRIRRNQSEDVFQLFINSFTSLLDPHSSYLTARDNEKFNSQMTLSMEGIGASLRMADEYIEIASFTPGGPAEKSKLLHVGDRIVGVGQGNKPIIDIIGWYLDDTVNLILGPKGSKVRLSILPVGATNSKLKTVELTREKINLADQRVKKSIKLINQQKIAILTIPSFYNGVTDDTKELLQQINRENINAVVIDLRMNFGGKLVEAINLSGLFIKKGPVVQVRNSNKHLQIYEDQDNHVYYSESLIVLTDRFSVSASEIFAAAMQDYGRALIVGETTYGKGTVQQQTEIGRFYDKIYHPRWSLMGAILYSNEKFYRISGDSTQLKGVTPDIIFPGNAALTDTGEAFTDNPLPWDRIPSLHYKKWQNLTNWLPYLTKKHLQRINKNVEFNYLIEEVQHFNENKEKQQVISLNYNQRMAEQNQDEMRRLKHINDRLTTQGKPKIRSLDMLDEHEQLPDPYLDEAIQIGLDFAGK